MSAAGRQSSKLVDGDGGRVVADVVKEGLGRVGRVRVCVKGFERGTPVGKERSGWRLRGGNKRPSPPWAHCRIHKRVSLTCTHTQTHTQALIAS